MKATVRGVTLRYEAIPSEIAREARETLRDRFGHALSVVSTQAPCRNCLRISREPEDLILLSYRPLEDAGPYAEVGPIFIHAAACDRYDNVEAFPPDFADRPLVLRAYDRAGAIFDATVAEPGSAPAVASKFLVDERVAQVHVRHVSYTCYDFRIVRGY
jgi:hypothetical protein